MKMEEGEDLMLQVDAETKSMLVIPESFVLCLSNLSYSFPLLSFSFVYISYRYPITCKVLFLCLFPSILSLISSFFCPLFHVSPTTHFHLTGKSCRLCVIHLWYPLMIHSSNRDAKGQYKCCRGVGLCILCIAKCITGNFYVAKLFIQ